MAETVEPIMRELFALLPPPGTEFPLVDRLRFLRAADAILRMLYKDDAASTAIDEAQHGTTMGFESL